MQLIPILVTSYLPTGEVDPTKQELVADSRDVATALGVQHGNLCETIKSHLGTIQEVFGQVRFQTETVRNSVGAANALKYFLLTEDQSSFVTTLSRNTEKAVAVKAWIVKSFREARDKIEEHNKAHPLVPALPVDYISALESLVAAEKEKLKLSDTLMLQAPKVAFANAVQETDDTMNIGSFAKSIGWGPNLLFAELRARGILFYRDGSNIPKQEYKKYFKVAQVPKNGRLYPMTTLTGAGMIWLTDLLGARK